MTMRRLNKSHSLHPITITNSCTARMETVFFHSLKCAAACTVFANHMLRLTWFLMRQCNLVNGEISAHTRKRRSIFGFISGSCNTHWISNWVWSYGLSEVHPSLLWVSYFTTVMQNYRTGNRNIKHYSIRFRRSIFFCLLNQTVRLWLMLKWVKVCAMIHIYHHIIVLNHVQHCIQW